MQYETVIRAVFMPFRSRSLLLCSHRATASFSYYITTSVDVENRIICTVSSVGLGQITGPMNVLKEMYSSD